MASVDGAKSYLEGSDEVPLHICGPCKDDGDDKEAKYWCEQCNEYLCSGCKDYHKKFKATKTHTILPGKPSKKESIAPESTFIVTCNCNKDRGVEIYCKDHSEVICSSCATIKHRKCNTTAIQDKLSGFSTQKFRSALGKAKNMIEKIENYQRDRKADCQKLKAMKEKCRKEIQEFRQEICNALEKMEETILKLLDDKAEQQLLFIEKQISTSSVALEALNLDLCLLENANRADKIDVMFSADMKTSNSLQEYEALILDIEANIHTPLLSFEKNQKLADLQSDIVSLGKVVGNKTAKTQKKKPNLVDMEVKSSNVVDIKLPKDEAVPGITDCAFMSNGYIVLCDNNNNCLKVLDKNLKITKQLLLPDIPYNVAALNDNETVVTYPYVKQLQCINIFPQLKLGQEIEMDEQCLGIEVAGGEIFTIFHKKSGVDEIWRLDRSGNIRSKVTLSQKASDTPYYLSLGTSENNARIYITDSFGSTLTCLRYDGSIVFQFKDKDLKRANGLYVDPEGNSLVCGTESNNVIIVTAEGKRHGELLTAKDNITKPKCVAFRPEDGTLVVGCWGSANLFVYKLG